MNRGLAETEVVFIGRKLWHWKSQWASEKKKGASLSSLGINYVLIMGQILCRSLYSSSHLILTNTLGGHYSLIYSPVHSFTELILGI